MRTPLAWLNLWNDKGRTATALAGTMFAVVLVLMQLGFFRSVLLTAGVLYDHLDFDAVVTSQQYRQMLSTGSFDRARLFAASQLPEVVSSSPLWLNLSLYRNPEDGLKRAILVVGADPQRRDILAATPEQMATLVRRDCVLLDELSRPEYGPRYVGMHSQIGDREVTVTGLVRIGSGFGADGIVITSDETFTDILFPRPLDQISLGLLRLKPGSDVDAVVGRLKTLLPPDVTVRSRADFLAIEGRYWVVKTSVGVIFGLGVIVSLLVGTMIVYQVLSSDVAKRMPEYATLKAMGYSQRYVSNIVLLQAITIGVVGFVPGWLVSEALYYITRRQAHIVMEMGTELPIAAFVLSVLMCCISGLASVRRLNAADPAELFA